MVLSNKDHKREKKNLESNVKCIAKRELKIIQHWLGKKRPRSHEHQTKKRQQFYCDKLEFKERD